MIYIEIYLLSEALTKDFTILGFRPYKKYVYGKDTFCIHFMYVSIVSVYKFHIFNKQFIFEHFLKKLMYTEKINHTECIRNF
ncbi:hypothetical protein GLOIN_2v1583187 [Rhizophagus irregularis DAOM 181602=DAOM 197198]|nr:hypothetical protein GLOIN_2v1583187 [Rhizophagus irregularis DAOM 181602=DAOM 197198]